MESVSRTFGKMLKARRLKMSMTQTQVAELIGKKQSQIVRLERGLADPRLSNVVEVSHALGLEIVAVPLRLLPAVKRLLKEHEQGTPTANSRLVGNDPEDAEVADDEI